MAIISLCFNAVKVEAYPSGYMFLIIGTVF